MPGWAIYTYSRISGPRATGVGHRRIVPQAPPMSSLEEIYDGVLCAFEQYAEDYLNETYTSFVHTPVVTIALGYRFY